jgi:uncharacterized Ntn-hydrolase superfamily protein
MKKLSLALGIVVLWTVSGFAQDYDPFYLSTFSIIARDAKTGELGEGVQSKAFAPGNRAVHIKGGVGVIAHQASANPMYGELGLKLLEAGMTPQQALDFMLRADSGKESRQVSILDAQGRGATFTGSGASDWKGGRCGPNYCVQANIMVGPEVVDALERSFLGSENKGMPLADRLMDALDAGQAAGGDARGVEGAYLVVARPTYTDPNVWNDRVVDLRVDDSKNPFAELRRLLNMTHSAELITQANRKATDKDFAGAVKLAQDAVNKSPENDNAYVALASMQLKNNQKAQALTTLKKAIELNPANKRQVPKNTNFQDVLTDPEFKKLVGQ